MTTFIWRCKASTTGPACAGTSRTAASLRNGYFPGRELSAAPPLLYLVTPVLRTHPATSVLLKYLSPEIEWQLVQLDEHWRAGVRVVNRQRGKKPSNHGLYTDEHGSESR